MKYWDEDSGRFIECSSLSFTGPSAKVSLLDNQGCEVDSYRYRRQLHSPFAGMDANRRSDYVSQDEVRRTSHEKHSWRHQQGMKKQGAAA